jgi:peptidyl-dipeptidase Dcp
MSFRPAWALALAVGFALPTHAAEAAKAAAAAPNPFFQPSTLPYLFPPFDKITDAHYLPAFEKGMAEQRAEIDAIANDPAAPTFENTIVAAERSGQTLTRVSNVFFALSGTNTNPEMERIQTVVAPKLAAHADAIALDPKLFARVSALQAKRDQLGLDAQQLRLLDRYMLDFVRAGAKLDEKQKTRLREINSELASLQTTFNQNLLKENNASAVVVETRVELAGLSDGAIAAAAEAAKSRELKGKYVLALQNTSGQPALVALQDRALRERLQKASVNRASHGGEFDNRATLARVVKLRAERAALLGYANYATYVLEDQTAGTPAAVNTMMSDMAPAALANAKAEAAAMQAIVDAGGGGFQIAAWDWAHYADKVRKAKYAYDDAELKPYFEMDNVLEKGVFHMAEKLYGLTFKERHDLPLYRDDVRVFEVFDSGKPLGLFIADYYARENKRGGAWMNEYVSQSGLFGTQPVVANHLNVPKPPKGEPTLLTFDEANTMFHEFGHAVHGLFSDVQYPRLAGTAVPLDFVEYPSQVHEMWTTWPEVLKNYARHHRTGELIPQALLDKVVAAQKFNQGFATVEYLGAAMLDQSYHQITADQAPTADTLLDFEAKALATAGVAYPPVPPRYRSTYFSHIVGGYGAGYYAYLWSEVLDADSVQWFEENGGLTRKNGDHFRKELLSRGGSVDAMQLYRNFRGRDPSVQPLLERRGLTAAPAAK